MKKVEKIVLFFKGLDNINELLDYVLQFKGDPRKSKTKLLNIIYTCLLIKEVVSIHKWF